MYSTVGTNILWLLSSLRSYLLAFWNFQYSSSFFNLRMKCRHCMFWYKCSALLYPVFSEKNSDFQLLRNFFGILHILAVLLFFFLKKSEISLEYQGKRREKTEMELMYYKSMMVLPTSLPQRWYFPSFFLLSDWGNIGDCCLFSWRTLIVPLCVSMRFWLLAQPTNLREGSRASFNWDLNGTWGIL